MPITAASSHSSLPRPFDTFLVLLPPQVIVARSMRKIECNKIARTGLSKCPTVWAGNKGGKTGDGDVDGEGPGEERELRIIAAISGNSLG